MKWEYAFFNILIFAVPLGLGYASKMSFRSGRKKALLAALVVSLPYLWWDALVTGRHWRFNEAYTLDFRCFGLPLEEIAFFVTVPFACLYMWEMLFADKSGESRGWATGLSWLGVGLCIPGALFWAQGKEYTALVCVALSGVALLDRWLKTSLLTQPRTYAYLALVALCTAVFNGYLTWRPVVLYEASMQLDFRVGTIPIEDFGYGFSLILLNLMVYQRLSGRVVDASHRSWASRLIERRFGGYKHQPNAVDAGLPYRQQEPHKVAVIGGGLAGLSAAMQCAKRGIQVTLFEKNHYLGGKVGSWAVDFPPEMRESSGEFTYVSHGFHAFFRHYYNLYQMMDELGIRHRLRQIEDYLIIDRQHARFGFREVLTTPLVNLLSLALHGVYRLSAVAFGKTGPKMESFLRYRDPQTFEHYDEVSFAQFSEDAKLPADLKMIFNTFARAFFAEPEKMSMAELIKSFHFYYLSHDHGLLYDYLDDDYDISLLQPLAAFLEARGVDLRLSTAVEELAYEAEGDEPWRVNGEGFRDVILAADVVGSKAVVEASGSLRASFPAFVEQMQRQKSTNRYSVLRLWLDGDLDPELPSFFITDRERVLDAVARMHRVEASSAAWVEKHGGGILELHCYAVPESVPSEQIRGLLLEEMAYYFPEFRDMTILHEHLQVREDFAAFHVGMRAHRPSYDPGIPGLHLAGDWVKLPYPAMLMEAACMSGLLCANAIFRREGLREEPVYTVPLQGFLVGKSNVS